MATTRTSSGWTTFPTPIGVCAVAWDTLGVTRFLLPAAEERILHKQIPPEAGIKTAPPPWVKSAIRLAVRHLGGDPQDFTDIPLNMNGLADFHKAVYRAALQVPSGECVTYGEIARKLGKPGAARAVGTALGKNPFALLVPCHRIVGSSGAGGFSAPGGLTTKARMLEAEGIALTKIPRLTPARIRAAARELSQRDPVMRSLLKNGRIPGLKLSPHQGDSPYEVLLEAVVHQQLSPAAARTILGRVKEVGRNKTRLPLPEEILKATPARLRSAGLSGAKVKAVQDLADRAQKGLIPTGAEMDRLTDEGIVRRLTPIYGIGRWTVEMLLIFHLGRPDVLPVDDYALRNAVGRALGRKGTPSVSEVREIGERWRPHRTTASLILWQSIDPPGT